MKTVHLELPEEVYKKLINKKKKGRYKNYSLVVEDLLFKDLEQSKKQEEIEKLMNYIYLILDLLKQFYSDMGIVGLSDPNKCKNLQKFFLKRKGLNND